MAESPGINATGVVGVTITANGKALDGVELVSISVIRRINEIPLARIVLLDGDLPGQDFPLSDSATFVPGAEVEISAGYGEDESVIFKGLVIRHSIKIGADSGARLVVECRDAAVRMTIGRHNAMFANAKDSDAISRLIGAHRGLRADVKPTEVKYPELVQYYCTDWDYMLSRAEVNGRVVIVNDGNVDVAEPRTSGAAVLTVQNGMDLMEFDADLDARSQLAAIDAIGWDPGAQENVAIEPVAPLSLNKQGNLSAKLLAQAVGPDTSGLQTSARLSKAALKAWATGAQLKAGLARIRGRMKFQGNARALPGTLIELKGVGERFAGDVYVSGVTHHIAAGNWTTDAEFGLSPDWFVQRYDVEAPNASGWIPGIEGLHIGVVTKLDDDPDGEFRIQVAVPVLRDDGGPIWARLTQAQASPGSGHFYIPEVDDEVVLGFFNNDPSQPVVLGCLYSSRKKPPHDMTASNSVKGFVSRENMHLTFDDGARSITLDTPAGNRIKIDEDSVSVVIEDQSGNAATLDATGITLSSARDISLDAKGKIDINAVGKIAIKSSSDVSVDGVNVKLSAQVGFSARGNASAELSSSGNTTVKGTMVMIN